MPETMSDGEQEWQAMCQEQGAMLIKRTRELNELRTELTREMIVERQVIANVRELLKNAQSEALRQAGRAGEAERELAALRAGVVKVSTKNSTIHPVNLSDPMDVRKHWDV